MFNCYGINKVTKEIEISFLENNSVVRVDVYEELDGCHKEELYISKEQVNRYEEEVEKIGKTMSKTKGFMKVVHCYTTIDWYDNCDVYYVPRIVYGTPKGSTKKKVMSGENYHESIPKDWEEHKTCYFKDVKTTKGIFMFLEVMNITISDEITKKIKQSFKNKKSYDFTI